jgi:hypothetical protein
MPRRIDSASPTPPTLTREASAPPKAPTKKPLAPAGDYYFKADSNVSYDAASRTWKMQLPNTTLTFDRKPAWLANLEERNAILDRSSAPARLHAAYDELRKIAEAGYDSSSLKLDDAGIVAHLGAESDRAFLTDLLALFKIALADETRSTFQYGGAMAGARCSEMHKLGGLVAKIEERLKTLP